VSGFPRVKGRLPPLLELCRKCQRHVMPGTDGCPHCSADVTAARERHEAAMQKWNAAVEVFAKLKTRTRH
jgi:hypothetical protein